MMRNRQAKDEQVGCESGAPRGGLIVAFALSEVLEVRQNLDETLSNMVRETGGDHLGYGWTDPVQKAVYDSVLKLRNKAANTINDIGRIRSS